MEVEGYIYYQGVCYDDDGHCDEYDLMFCRCDTGKELCLNGFEHAIFPNYYDKENQGMSPMSVHDKMRGKLTLKFDKQE